LTTGVGTGIQFNNTNSNVQVSNNFLNGFAVGFNANSGTGVNDELNSYLNDTANTTNELNILTMNSSGFVSIGTTMTGAALLVTRNNNPNVIFSQNVGGTGSSGGGGIVGSDSIAPTAQGDRLGFYLLGAAGANAAGIQGFADQAWTLGSAQGSNLTFETTPDNSATRAEAMRITAAGFVGLDRNDNSKFAFKRFGCHNSTKWKCKWRACSWSQC